MSQQKSPKKSNKGFKNGLALTGIALEMGVIIFLSAKGGRWLDSHFQTNKNYWTVFLTLFGVAISIWLVLRQLKRLNP
ncbi:MAG: AtpZ/AtpI family protein [Bacteroidota bacterium]